MTNVMKHDRIKGIPNVELEIEPLTSLSDALCDRFGHKDKHDEIGSYVWGHGMVRWFHCERCLRNGFRKIPDEELKPEERKIKERVEKHHRENPQTYASAMTFKLDPND